MAGLWFIVHFEDSENQKPYRCVGRNDLKLFVKDMAGVHCPEVQACNGPGVRASTSPPNSQGKKQNRYLIFNSKHSESTKPNQKQSNSSPKSTINQFKTLLLIQALKITFDVHTRLELDLRSLQGRPRKHAKTFGVRGLGGP